MMSRDVRLSIKISEDNHAQLKHMADSYGVTMSALSALILGQWLYQQNQIVKPMVESMKDVIADVVRDAIEKEKQEHE